MRGEPRRPEDRIDRDVEDEIAFHLESRVRLVDPAEALRAE